MSPQELERTAEHARFNLERYLEKNGEWLERLTDTPEALTIQELEQSRETADRVVSADFQMVCLNPVLGNLTQFR